MTWKDKLEIGLKEDATSAKTTCPRTRSMGRNYQRGQAGHQRFRRHAGMR